MRRMAATAPMAPTRIQSRFRRVSFLYTPAMPETNKARQKPFALTAQNADLLNGRFGKESPKLTQLLCGSQARHTTKDGQRLDGFWKQHRFIRLRKVHTSEAHRAFKPFHSDGRCSPM